MVHVYDCNKCGFKLDTSKGTILVMYPVYFNKHMLIYTLCSMCYLEVDKKCISASEFGKWIDKKVSR